MAESESVMVVEPSSSSRMDQKETLQVDESALADRKHDLSEIFVSNHIMKLQIPRLNQIQKS